MREGGSMKILVIHGEDESVAIDEQGETLEGDCVRLSVLSGGEGGEEYSVEEITTYVFSFPAWARKALINGRLLDQPVCDRVLQLTEAEANDASQGDNRASDAGGGGR